MLNRDRVCFSVAVWLDWRNGNVWAGLFLVPLSSGQPLLAAGPKWCLSLGMWLRGVDLDFSGGRLAPLSVSESKSTFTGATALEFRESFLEEILVGAFSVREPVYRVVVDEGPWDSFVDAERLWQGAPYEFTLDKLVLFPVGHI